MSGRPFLVSRFWFLVRDDPGKQNQKPETRNEERSLPAILIFALTYLVLAIGRLPGFRVDRTGAAIIGASLMVAVNALTLSEAQQAINFDTIILLFGMMIVVANLQLSGFFSLVAERVVEHAHRPVLALDRHRRRRRLLLRVFRQRHHVPGADSAGA